MEKNNVIQDVTVTLTIKNNVNYPVPINILGNIFNPLDTSNATTQYQYNLTGFSITTENTIGIQYKPIGATSFSLFTTTFIGTNLQDIVNGLNLLGIGFFVLYTESGSTYISTYNDNYVFALLNIYNPTSISLPPSALFDGEMTGTSGSVDVYVNLVATSFIVPPSFSVQTPLIVTSTDTIRIAGVASNSNSKKVAYIINLTTGVTIFYINLSIGESFDSGNILVGNNSYQLSYFDY
jgi:hypothetical protein